MPNPQEARTVRAITPDKFNEVVRATKELRTMFAEQQIDVAPSYPGFWAQIEGEDPTQQLYSWDEIEVYDGEFQIKTNGRRGRIDGVADWTDDTEQPAREVNGLQGVPAGAIVWMCPNAPSSALTTGGVPDSNHVFSCPDLTQIVTIQPTADVDASGAMKGKARVFDGSEYVDAYDCWVASPAGSWEFFKIGCLMTGLTTLARWIGYIDDIPLFLAANSSIPLTEIAGYSASAMQVMTHTADGCLEWVDAQTCSGSGSGSGSGGGGSGDTVTVGCCENPLPTTLYITFGGDYSGIGTIALTWQGSEWQNLDGADPGCGDPLQFSLYCLFGTWYIEITPASGTTSGRALSVTSCDPLLLTGNGANSDSGCNPVVPVTITEVAP